MQILTGSAREAILRSIREHLAESVPHETVRQEEEHREFAAEILPPDNRKLTTRTSVGENKTPPALREIFRENLEAVGGHCIVAASEAEVIEALDEIIAGLRKTPLRARRIALSDAPLVEHLVRQITVETDEIAVVPGSADLFEYDVGITTAQAAIAETGTLVLESECERHRLVSLVPPVHIAIVDGKSICLTLGEALAALHRRESLTMSPTITLITGPSRTADIELTLAIGVHGPQELYVIVNEGQPLTAD